VEHRFKYKLNQFIDEAVKEKILRETLKEREKSKVSWDVGRVVHKTKSYTAFEPGPKMRKEMEKERKIIAASAK
jgi:hypothetical protein